MDVKELCVRRCVNCRKSQHVTTCETSTQNGHMDVNTINQVCCGIFKNHVVVFYAALSFQVILQDHNYGAPLPLHNNTHDNIVVGNEKFYGKH